MTRDSMSQTTIDPTVRPHAPAARRGDPSGIGAPAGAGRRPGPLAARRRPRSLLRRLFFGVFGRVFAAVIVWTAPPAAAARAQSASNGWLSSTELEHIAAEERRGEENLAERRGKEPGPPEGTRLRRTIRRDHDHFSLLHRRPVLPRWIKGQRKVRVRMHH